jgi:hypothetical protein
MKFHTRLILSGLLLVCLSFAFAACSPQTQPAPTATSAPAATEAKVVGPVLEIVGPSETKSLTLDELKALPVTEGYAGIKSSTGKVTPPIMVKGVALKDFAKLIGGMDATTGFNVVAEDGYSITYSFDQIENGSFIAYDPATGAELKTPVPLTVILAYEADGKPFDPKQDGTLRLAIVSSEVNQVTDGHWSVKWVNKLEVKSLGAEWGLKLDGAISKVTDRASIESCGAPQCHGATWTDDKAQKWVGVPLWLFVGTVDDQITHEGPAFNDALAAAGYNVDVIASDGYTVTFDAARVKRNNNIIVAYKVNENPLPDEFFPLRLVGSDLTKKEMAGKIAQIKVGIPPIPATETAATEAPTVSAPAAAGSLVVTGAVNKELSLLEADLRALEVAKITAKNPKGGSGTYEGVRLSTLLELAGVTGSAAKVRFTASDGYYVEVSIKDLKACADCMVAFTSTAEKFKLVMPGMTSDFWVKDVNNIEIQ